jgi:N-acetylmuramoyl-L-alanine amidase
VKKLLFTIFTTLLIFTFSTSVYADTIYTVKSGDTLWSISRTNQTSVDNIKQYNNLSTNTIRLGQNLIVSKDGSVSNTTPTSNSTYAYYTVKSGDTLYGIARTYKMSVAALIELNGLTNNIIHSGQKLKVVGSSTTTTPNVGPTTTGETGIVTADVLNVRKGPSTAYGIAGTVKNGQSITILTKNAGWAQIRSGSLSGYVSLTYVKITDPNTTVPTTPTSPSVIAKGKTILLDPGHGGADPGAIGMDGTTYEKSVALNFSSKMKTSLENNGYKVIMTRTGDTRCGTSTASTDLQCRVTLGNNNNADLFISVHANWAYASSAYGMETYYNSTNTYDGNMNPYPAESKRLAQLLHNNIRPQMNVYDRGVRNANLYVNRMANMPSVLLELGFLSNSSDLGKLKNATT